MIVSTSEARHLLVRLPEGARLTEAIASVLRDQIILAGWLRASGALADVELRVVDGRTGVLGPARRIEGHVHLVSMEGGIGLSGDDPTFGARALLAREGALGLETFAGEVVDARVVAVEVLVTALDQVSATRATQPSGVTLLASATLTPAAVASAPAVAPSSPAIVAPPPAPSAPSAPAAAWAEAARASEVAQKPPPPPPPPAPKPAASAVTTGMAGAHAMPPKPVRPPSNDEDQLYPDAGDTVEHFAFGRCEVLKSDGDRLHVRAKDGRIKEIALEMLKVTSLPPIEGQTSKHFKLDRKL